MVSFAVNKLKALPCIWLLRTLWELSRNLVDTSTKVDVPDTEAECKRSKTRINAFLPIVQLTKQGAVDLCHKFGDNTYIAGNFADVADFDEFYADLFANKKFVEECRLELQTKVHPHKVMCKW